MRAVLLAGVLIPLALGQARAQQACSTIPCTVSPASIGAASASALAAVQKAIPQPSTAVPPGATPGGTAGTAATFLPSDATAPSLTRSARVTTASDGTFSVTWATPLVSSSPVGLAVPVMASASLPVTCLATAITSTTFTGKCFQALAVTVASLGSPITPFTAAPGVSVSVFAREPTQ